MTHDYLTKGRKVLVEGHLISDKATGGPRIWNRPDGSAGASFEVSADVVRVLSSPGVILPEPGETAPQEKDIPF